MNIKAIFILFLIYQLSLSTKLNQHSYTKQKENLIQILQNKDYTIDYVLSLLNQLRDQSKSDLATNIANFNSANAQLADQLNNFINIRDQQQKDCNELTNQFQIINKKIEINEEQQLKNSDQIKNNNNKIDSIKKARCDENDVYIKGLKENQESLNLFDFLKQTLNNFTSTSQLSQLYERLNNVNEKSINVLIEASQMVPDQTDTQKRTAQQAGTGHIDNNKNQITIENLDPEAVEKLSAVKLKLLNLIDTLVKETQQKIKQNEDAELDAIDKLADIINNLERENRYLTKDNLSLAEELKQLNSELNDIKDKLNTCQKKLDQDNQNVQNKQNEKLALENKHNLDVNNLNQEIQLFEDVLSIYKEQIYKLSDQYKNRSEDYVEDQVFDKTQDFENRNADQYWKSQQQVQDQIQNQAQSDINQLKNAAQSEQEYQQNRDQKLQDLRNLYKP